MSRRDPSSGEDDPPKRYLFDVVFRWVLIPSALFNVMLSFDHKLDPELPEILLWPWRIFAILAGTFCCAFMVALVVCVLVIINRD